LNQRWVLLAVLLSLFGPLRPGQAQQGGICGAAQAKGVIDVAGYFTAKDNFQHAIVSNDGSLYEVFFDPARGIFQSHLGRFPDTIAIAGYSAPADSGRQSIIVGRANGEVHQVWFGAPPGPSSALLDRVAGLVDVGALYSDDSGRQHAIALANTGEVVELAWQPGTGLGVQRTTLTRIPGAQHAAGFFTRDDHSNIVLVATASGDVWELFYKDPAHIGQSVVYHSGEPILDIAGFYTDDDQFRHAIVASRSGVITEVFYHPVKGKGVTALLTVGGLRRIAAYATTPTDSYRHVIAALDSGEVRELFYSPKVGKGFGLLKRFSPETPAGEDVSVDQPNNQPQPQRGSEAGLTVAMAGDEQTLYAVSLDAGVWRADNGGPWSQLASSPPLALSIAVDPANRSHVAVGERNGDAYDLRLNRAGVWESFDAGVTWSYTLNPRSLAGCSEQQVPGLAFDGQSNLYAATGCGMAKRLAGGAAFELLAGTTGAGAFTAVATQNAPGGPAWLWGRTVDAFFVSQDAGATWSQVPIPATIGADRVLRGARGDHFSLAAFDASAFTIASTGRGSATIAYNAQTKGWSLSDIADGDGTGLGGRRFVKSAFVHLPGRPWVLLAGTAQGMFLGTPGGAAIAWKRIAEAPWALGPGDKHVFNPTSAIHTDLWDAAVGTAGNPSLWLSSDGGVYRSDLASSVASPPGVSPPYAYQDQGLHTHHAHTLSLLTEGMTRRSKLVYSVADNDEWLRNSTAIVSPNGTWRTWGQQGDSNWTAADVGSSPVALIQRNGKLSHLTAFGDPSSPPAAKPWADAPRGFQIYPASTLASEEQFQVIQTLANETPQPLVDAVLLSAGAQGRTVLLRTHQFAANPDATLSKLGPPTWTVEDANLPDGAARVWSSGGHQNPVYYLYAESGGTGRLFRRSGPGAAWVDLTPALGKPLFAVPFGALYGPAFVNPYDPRYLFVLTAGGVRVSRDGGASFADDTALTALITGSGKFPLGDGYLGGNGTGVVHWSQARRMGTLSQVAFFRDNPAKVVAAAPYTGTFYRDDACGSWQSLTPFLPHPVPAIPSVGIDHQAAYVALEGRSVWRVDSYEFAPLASYFTHDGLTLPQVARLLRADGSGVATAAVQVTVTKEDGELLFHGPVGTDGAGVLSLPGALPPGTYVLHLDFPGANAVAPGSTSLLLTVS